MNVVHIINQGDEAGWRTYADLLMAEKEMGHNSAAAVPKDRLAERLAAAGVETVATTALGGTADILSAARLAGVLKKSRADIVHAHGEASARIALMAARRGGVRAAASVYRPGPSRFFRAFDKLFPATQEVCESLFVAGVEAHRMRRVYHGFDLAPYERSSEPSGLREDWGFEPAARILGAADLDEDPKAENLLFQAFSFIEAREPAARLAAVCSGEPAARLSGRFRQAGLEDKLRIVDEMDEFAFFPSIDAMLFTGRPGDRPADLAARCILHRRPAAAMTGSGLSEIVNGGDPAGPWAADGPAALGAVALNVLSGGDAVLERLERAFDFVAREFDVRRSALIFEMERQEIIALGQPPRTA